jgi:hypothetical protein
MPVDAANPASTPLAGDTRAPVAAPAHASAAPVGGVGTPILAAALLLGLTGDLLLRQVPWGINFPIGILVLVAAVVLLARRFGGETRAVWWLAAEAVAFASAVAWRASAPLVLLNVLAVMTALLLMPGALDRQGPGLVHSRVRDYVASAVRSVLGAIGGSLFLLGNDVRFGELTGSRRTRHLAGVVRGLVLAAPLLIIFGALFASADAVFERAVHRLLRFDVETLVSHVMVAAALTWLAGGFLRAAVLRHRRRALPAELEMDPIARLGIVEVAVVIGLLDLLFLAFVGVQVGYLFGGGALVERSAGMTYAAYARRGFFELMFVAVLALPVMLGANALLRRDAARDERIFRGLAAAMIVLLFVIMASAVQRMRLYTDQFGLTESRVYAIACMAWLAMVFTWFGATVLRGRLREFAVGALAAGALVIGTLNAIGPDGLIVRSNVARLADGRPLDVKYIAWLGDDAVPELVRVYPRLTTDQQCLLRGRLLPMTGAAVPGREAGRPAATDWRSWNIGRARARASVARNEAMIRNTTCPIPEPQTR